VWELSHCLVHVFEIFRSACSFKLESQTKKRQQQKHSISETKLLIIASFCFWCVSFLVRFTLCSKFLTNRIITDTQPQRISTCRPISILGW